jgi:hypothetical protein
MQIRLWNLIVDCAEKAIFKFDYGSPDVQQESHGHWSDGAVPGHPFLVGIGILSPGILAYSC